MKNNPNIISRTAYTFFESILSIDSLISFSLENNYEDVWLVEKNIMYSSMEFYNKSIKNNLKPKIGLEIDYGEIRTIVFAKNIEGYYELVKISSYIMLEKEINHQMINSVNLIKIEIDEFNISSYKGTENISALKTFSKIGNKVLDFSKMMSLVTKESFLEQNTLYKYEKIVNISNSINLVIPKKINVLPNYKDEKNKEIKDPEEYLREILNNKLKEFLIKNKIQNKNIIDKYLNRVKYEFDVIQKMKYSSYFLIVWDIVKWSKNNNIMVGPGRGSAAGSLVSFLLNITIVDPIKTNLIFERFLNPDRVSMPDIDIDFEDKRRDEVINYIVTKYGIEYTSSIITFQTLRAKMSFKDIARFYEVPASNANEISKNIFDDKPLEETFKKSKSFRYTIESNELYEKIYNEAKLVEGLPRQYSTHAAGIVLSQNKIIDNIPIQKGYNEDIFQTQYSMNYLEENGLLKIDILGLRNLSFLKEILESIQKNKKVKIELDMISFDDEKVFELLSKGLTGGIFQLESDGMKSILKKLKPTSFEDIVATISLYRPGPMEQIPHYIKRKNNEEKFEYFDKDHERILQNTYGIMVYQEQIMEIVKVFSSFTLSKADILRKAIGKKDEILLNKLKDEFILGAKNNDHNDETINDIWEKIFKFSDYGFNRSHAYSYAIISYWLAWLKSYYPIEFMCSLLTSNIGNVKKTIEYIDETEKMGIKVSKPNINNPSLSYKMISQNEIQISLLSIKGIGMSSLKIIIEEFKKGQYLNYFDFVTRTISMGLKKSYLELLIKAGALDIFEYNRNEMLESLENIFEYMDLALIKGENGFEIDELINVPIIEKQEKKDYDKFEIEAFTFNLEEKPFNKIEMSKISENDLKGITDVIDIEEIQDREYEIIGAITSIRELKTKWNKYMLFANIEDKSGKISITLWPNIYDKFKDIIEVGKSYKVKGKVDIKRQKTLIISSIKLI